MCIHVSLSCDVQLPHTHKKMKAKTTQAFKTCHSLPTKKGYLPSCWPSSGDPFLPECPVIGLNPSAQALTGWAAAGAF